MNIGLFRASRFLIFFLLYCHLYVNAQDRTWRTPVDASFAACNGMSAQGVLMDDGTLLLICQNNQLDAQAINAPLWQRSANGNWTEAATPPTRTSRAIAIRKLSGSVAVITWNDYFNQGGRFPLTRLQIWSVDKGVGAAFSIPGPLNQSTLEPIWESWGLDNRAIRIRPSRVDELPTPTSPPISVIELVDQTGQAVGSSLSLNGRRLTSSAGSCLFPNGDRLVALLSIDPKLPNSPTPQGEIQVAILRKSGAWEGPTSIANGWANEFAGIRPLCLANNIARVIFAFGAPSQKHYVDHAGSDGWRQKQILGAIGFPPGIDSSSILSATSFDGRAIVAWNFPETPIDKLTGQPSHSSIPVIQWIKTGSKYFITDFNMPLYDADASADTGVRAVAWDPKLERFVFVLAGGSGPNPRRMFVDFRLNGVWSTATNLPKQMLSNWQLDFNSSGDGVLLAYRHGALLISDWR